MNRVDRDQAVARVVAEHRGRGCLMCDLLGGGAGPVFAIERGRHATTVLSRYALRPGHALVVVHDHVTSIGELDEAAWLEVAAMSRRASLALDRVFRPTRCFVASLGTDVDVPMSSAHLHVHVIPVESGVRPSEVLTWSNGVFVPTEAELVADASRLRVYLKSCTAQTEPSESV